MSKVKSESYGITTVTKKVHMYLCLIPVFGVVPAVLALVRDRSGHDLKQTSKLAIVLFLTWAISYSALGGGQDAESMQVSLEILKGTLSSGYFATSIWLMWQLYKGNKIKLPWSDSQGDAYRRSVKPFDQEQKRK